MSGSLRYKMRQPRNGYLNEKLKNLKRIKTNAYKFLRRNLKNSLRYLVDVTLLTTERRTQKNFNFIKQPLSAKGILLFLVQSTRTKDLRPR